MARENLTPAVQDYLKEICRLELEGTRASTSTVAARLGVTAASVTGMAKKLAEQGLVARRPYRSLRLTATGRQAALEMLRHHRLLEQYLVQSLGLPLDEVHDEAERLEHALSEELEERIDSHLGRPTHDPHGEPIPDSELRIAEPSWRPLSSLEPGERSTVRRVPDTDPALLRYLASLALVPGAAVEVTTSAPFDGPITVRSDAGQHALSRELAAAIGVA
jgi:DtxR family Mn-dependent transcriptional regulator